MKKFLALAVILAFGLSLLTACETPSRHIAKMRLGMSPKEVLDVMGDPFTVRASKKYEGGETTEVWEYIAPVFSAAAFSDKYDKSYWIIFENGKVVQWGEPGDFSGTDAATGPALVKDYLNKKILK